MYQETLAVFPLLPSILRESPISSQGEEIPQKTAIMTKKLDALSEGSLVLVTGANGYIGSNIVDCLLQLGFKVRGTVRAPKPWLDQLFQEKYGIDVFESVVIPSFEDEAAVNDAMTDVAGVMHVVREKIGTMNDVQHHR